jgi:hypothetical protein
MGARRETEFAEALDLFDRAAVLGQGYAKLEAAGMRMEGEAAAQVAWYRAQCSSRGGIYDGETCTMGGMPFDPYESSRLERRFFRHRCTA